MAALLVSKDASFPPCDSNCMPANGFQSALRPGDVRSMNRATMCWQATTATALVVLMVSGCGDARPRSRLDEATSSLSWREEIDLLKRSERKSLNFSTAPVSDDDLVLVKELPWLRELVVPTAEISDQGTHHLIGLDDLQELVLGDTDIGDDGLAEIGRLLNLRKLNLNRSRVTDDGLRYLAGLESLELLRFGTSEITDAGLAEIGRLKSLRFLMLQNAQITGSGLKHLHGLKSLESLYLQGNPLTAAEEIEDLRRALPNLHPDW